LKRAEVKGKQTRKILRKAERQTGRNHKRFLAALKKELTPAQTEAVKDGLTYGILPRTYNGYLDMLPGLTEKQKARIMEWLVEAREKAMDGGSSDEKHAWFGKYKGKINNYLSSEGYDLKKAGEDWQKRIKEK